MYIKTVEGWKPLHVNSVPAPKDPTFMESSGMRDRKPGQTADKYCEAIRRYLLPYSHPEHITEDVMNRMKSEAIRGIF